jgi:hypothetical protein
MNDYRVRGSIVSKNGRRVKRKQAVMVLPDKNVSKPEASFAAER